MPLRDLKGRYVSSIGPYKFVCLLKKALIGLYASSKGPYKFVCPSKSRRYRSVIMPLQQGPYRSACFCSNSFNFMPLSSQIGYPENWVSRNVCSNSFTFILFSSQEWYPERRTFTECLQQFLYIHALERSRRIPWKASFLGISAAIPFSSYFLALKNDTLKGWVLRNFCSNSFIFIPFSSHEGYPERLSL